MLEELCTGWWVHEADHAIHWANIVSAWFERLEANIVLSDVPNIQVRFVVLVNVPMPHMLPPEEVHIAFYLPLVGNDVQL
jgi:hypothetical protein